MEKITGEKILEQLSGARNGQELRSLICSNLPSQNFVTAD